MRPIEPTPNRTTAPAGMVAIPAASSYEFVVSGLEIEPGKANPHATPQGPNGQGEEGVDVQFPWETVSGYNHLHTMSVPAFFIDETPVTRAQYASYLTASNYSPSDDTNFLANWTRRGGSWEFAPADAEKPVTHVSLNEAREFCAYYRKRLPHCWEWQLAAQGLDGRLFPWGNDSTAAIDGTRCPAYRTAAGASDQDGLRFPQRRVSVWRFGYGGQRLAVHGRVRRRALARRRAAGRLALRAVLRSGERHVSVGGGLPDKRERAKVGRRLVLPERAQDAAAQHARALPPHGRVVRESRHDWLSLRG